MSGIYFEIPSISLKWSAQDQVSAKGEVISRSVGDNWIPKNYFHSTNSYIFGSSFEEY